MTARQLLSLLHRAGCLDVRQKGSHLMIECGSCRTIVPVHNGDIPKGTLRSIERDLEGCLGPGWLNRLK